MRTTQQTNLTWQGYSLFVRNCVPRILPVLIETAQSHHTITYGNICARVGLQNTQISKPLGCIARLLKSLEDEKPIPPLTAVAVYAATQLPAPELWTWGILENGESWDDTLQRIYQYLRWDEVETVLLDFMNKEIS